MSGYQGLGEGEERAPASGSCVSVGDEENSVLELDSGEGFVSQLRMGCTGQGVYTLHTMSCTCVLCVCVSLTRGQTNGTIWVRRDDQRGGGNE